MYNATFVFFLSTHYVLCLIQCYIHYHAEKFETSKLRCVYRFVTYITLCNSRGDFDITHVFSLTAEKVIFVTLLCISSRDDGF